MATYVTIVAKRSLRRDSLHSARIRAICPKSEDKAAQGPISINVLRDFEMPNGTPNGVPSDKPELAESGKSGY